MGMPFAGFAPVVAVALGAAVLAGCQSEAPPTPSPSPSVTASSASPSASAPASPSPSASGDLPAAAREKTEKGAEAFVAHFFAQVNAAWMTAEPSHIRGNSEPECKSCAALAETATELQGQGRRYAAEPIDVRGITATSGAPQGQQFVQADLVQNEVDILDAKGSVVGTDKKADFQRTVALIWVGDRWLVYDVA